MRLAWALPSMEIASRLRALFIYRGDSCFEEGASSVARTFRAQIAVRFVSEGCYSLVSEYYGVVS